MKFQKRCPSGKRESTTIRFSPAERRMIDEVAKAEGRSMADVIMMGIRALYASRRIMDHFKDDKSSWEYFKDDKSAWEIEEVEMLTEANELWRDTIKKLENQEGDQRDGK